MTQIPRDTSQRSPSKRSRPAALALTQRAVSHVRSMIAQADPEDQAIGLRVSLRAGGCSGYKYVVTYAADIKPHEEVITQDGITVIIDPTAVMFLLGCEMDYTSDTFESGFVFNNPNETGRCGCGESISFQDPSVSAHL